MSGARPPGDPQLGRGLFEIDGVPEDVLRHFSQRPEIEEHAAELVSA